MPPDNVFARFQVPVLLFNVSVSFALFRVPLRFTVPPVRTKLGKFKAAVVSVPAKSSVPPATRSVPGLDQLAAPSSRKVFPESTRIVPVFVRFAGRTHSVWLVVAEALISP